MLSNSTRSHRPICKRVGRGSSSYVRFEGLLGPAQVEQARKFAASQPVQEALSTAKLFNGPGASRERRSRVAWLDRVGHESDRETAFATYPSWLHNRLRDCARETHDKLGDKWCPIGRDRRGRVARGWGGGTGASLGLALTALNSCSKNSISMRTPLCCT